MKLRYKNQQLKAFNITLIVFVMRREYVVMRFFRAIEIRQKT